jgi:transcription elongation factor GreA-like protein
MTLEYQRSTAVLLLIHGSPFLSGTYYRQIMFWCAVVRMSELLFKLGNSGSEIREMLVQVYADNVIKKRAVYKWVTRFSEGRESVTDEERSGRPATSRTKKEHRKILSHFS